MRSIKRGLDKSSIAVFLLPYIILFTLFYNYTHIGGGRAFVYKFRYRANA